MIRDYSRLWFWMFVPNAALLAVSFWLMAYLFFAIHDWFAVAIFGVCILWNMNEAVDNFRRWRKARREYLESVLDAIAKLDK